MFGGFGESAPQFDGYDQFEPAHLPAPGPTLEGHEILTGREHAAFHRCTRDLFEERGVYDATFGYNLARLNLDQRHPDAGFRYARDAEDPTTLRAEFRPTTEFCPQVSALTRGAYRAWNDLADRHEYETVVVRVHPEHHEAEGVNAELRRLAAGEIDVQEAVGTGGDASAPGTDSPPTAPF